MKSDQLCRHFEIHNSLLDDLPIYYGYITRVGIFCENDLKWPQMTFEFHSQAAFPQL